MPGIDQYTMLMLHFDGTDAGTTFTDSSTNQAAKTQTAIGNGQLDTAQFKFGSASYLGDGTGDGLSSPDSDDWDMGTGAFTVDCWARFADKTDTTTLFARGPDNFAINWNGSETLNFIMDGAGVNISYGAWAPANDTWYHIAVDRSGTTVNLYIDGTSVANGTSAYDVQGTTAFYVGMNSDGSGRSWNGWIDEFRVSKGVARYAGNFTPATEAYTASAIKTINGLALASVKTVNGLAIASRKTWNGLA